MQIDVDVPLFPVQLEARLVGEQRDIEELWRRILIDDDPPVAGSTLSFERAGMRTRGTYIGR